jgi:hypothetical protein
LLQKGDEWCQFYLIKYQQCAKMKLISKNKFIIFLDELFIEEKQLLQIKTNLRRTAVGMP